MLLLLTPLIHHLLGMKLLARHQRMNALLAEELKTIHALSLRTWTPAQWEKKKAAP